jgi:hypothetical protein
MPHCDHTESSVLFTLSIVICAFFLMAPKQVKVNVTGADEQRKSGKQ